MRSNGNLLKVKVKVAICFLFSSSIQLKSLVAIKGAVPSRVLISVVLGKNLITKRVDFIHMCPLKLKKKMASREKRPVPSLLCGLYSISGCLVS